MNRLLLFMFLVSIFACQENSLPSKKMDLFREALRKPLVKKKTLPILQNEFFDELSKTEIIEYTSRGIDIWKREDLFMRAISDFITINQVDLKDETLVIDFQYPVQEQIIHERVYYRSP